METCGSCVTRDGSAKRVPCPDVHPIYHGTRCTNEKNCVWSGDHRGDWFMKPELVVLRWWSSEGRRTRIGLNGRLKCEKLSTAVMGASVGQKIYNRGRRAVTRIQEMGENGSVGGQPESGSTSDNWKPHCKIRRETPIEWSTTRHRHWRRNVGGWIHPGHRKTKSRSCKLSKGRRDPLVSGSG